MKKLFPAFVSILVLALAGCGKDDDKPVIPATQLDIQVTDLAGAGLEGVPVSLYASSIDWIKEQNPVQTTTTTQNGLARFVYLTDSAYYVSAETGELSNWENNFKLSGIEQGKAHTANIVLGNYDSHQIASPEGKFWRIIRYKVNGADLTDDTTYSCITDNFWVFYKGNKNGRFERRENNTFCQPNSPEMESGSWQLNDEGSTLKIPEGGQVVTYNLIHLSPATIRVEKQSAAGLVEFTLVNP